jgi:hypothetical protein
MPGDSQKPANDPMNDEELSKAMKELAGKGGAGEPPGGA